MKIIVACDEERGIGKDGTIPWMGRYPEDLKFFRAQTLGFEVIMGRKTMESLKCKPLIKRKNWVLTSQSLIPKGFHRVASFEEVVQKCSKSAWIIGGESVYNKALELEIVDKIVMTNIPGKYNCDRHFPSLSSRWTMINQTRHHILNISYYS